MWLIGGIILLFVVMLVVTEAKNNIEEQANIEEQQAKIEKLEKIKEFTKKEVKPLLSDILEMYEYDLNEYRNDNGHHLQDMTLEDAKNIVETRLGYNDEDTLNSVASQLLELLEDDIYFSWMMNGQFNEYFENYSEYRKIQEENKAQMEAFEEDVKREERRKKAEEEKKQREAEKERQYYNSDEYFRALYKQGYNWGTKGRGLPSTQRADAWSIWLASGHDVGEKYFIYFEMGYKDGVYGRKYQSF